MTVVYKLLKNGGFVAGDAESGVTSYAYPTSPYALTAKKHPKAVAEEMLEFEQVNFRSSETIQEYDQRNWARLAE